MRIWTTKQISDRFLAKDFPITILPENELQQGYLHSAKNGDVAILDFDDQYLRFLNDVKTRGLPGPIVFISPEPTMAKADLHQYHAVILDSKSMGAAGVESFIQFILRLALTRVVVASPHEPTLEPEKPARPGDAAIENPANIMDVLHYGVKAAMPVLVAFEISDHGTPVTARGICSIKELRENKLVLHRFRQALLLKGLKKGLKIKLFLSYKDRNDEGLVEIIQGGDAEIVTTIPAHLFPTKDMRIQPSAQKPVKLYITIPDEPTTNYKVVDISPRGLSFLCPRELPVGAVYNFTLILPDPDAVALCYGTIRYRKDAGADNRYGVEIRPHPWDEENIAKYIMKREAEIIGLFRSM